MVICPTITASTLEDYKRQLDNVSSFALEVHIDLMDGNLAQTRSIAISEIYWPDGMLADIHIMYRKPSECLNDLIKLKPQLVIIHAEAEDDYVALARELHQAGIKAGLALLPETSVGSVVENLSNFDQVLIFGGHLGYQGGHADLTQIHKVEEVKKLNPYIQIAWDGGINDQNIRELSEAGVEVFNVGSFIQASPDPDAAYAKLLNSLS